MNLSDKLKHLDVAIRSIAEHDDEDLVVVDSALDVAERFIDRHRVAAHERRAAKVSAMKESLNLKDAQ